MSRYKAIKHGKHKFRDKSVKDGEIEMEERRYCSGCKYNVASISNGQVAHHCVTDEGMMHYDPNFGKFGAEVPDWCPIK